MNQKLNIDSNGQQVSAIFNDVNDPIALLVLAHGAGAGMEHAFMEKLSSTLNDQSIAVLRFNFPYIDQGRRSPDSPKKAQETIKNVESYCSHQWPDLPMIIGGKSYGGRMASHCAALGTIPSTRGLVFYGFPLHAPGRDSKDRANHLSDVNIPMLFLQGTNDKLANYQMMSEVTDEHHSATLIGYELADHSFKVPKKSGRTQEEIIDQLAIDTRNWLEKSGIKN